MAKSMYSSLNPETTYYGPNDAKYHTDNYGRVGRWSAQVSDQSEARNPYAQRSLEGKNPDQSHAGHLLASSQGGSGEKYNMVPMNDKVNTRDYRAFERENSELTQNGYTVTLTGSNSYPLNSEGENVPEAIMVDREVSQDGQYLYTEHTSWTNLDMAELENQGEEEAAELSSQYENPGAYIYNEDENIVVNQETGAIIDVGETDMAESYENVDNSEGEGISNSDSLTL